jgi:hypothetical protein
MAISAISSSGAVQAVQPSGANLDAQKLQKSLAAGSSSVAQATLSQFQKQLPNFGGSKGPGVGTAPPPPDAGSTLKQDLQTLQNALAAGDLAGAQNAFSKLKEDSGEIDPPKAGVKPPDESEAKAPAKSGSEHSEVDPRGAQAKASINIYA